MKSAKIQTLSKLKQSSSNNLSHGAYVNNISHKHCRKHGLMLKVLPNTCLEVITLKGF